MDAWQIIRGNGLYKGSAYGEDFGKTKSELYNMPLDPVSVAKSANLVKFT